MKDYTFPNNLVFPIIAQNENKALELATAGYYRYFDQYGLRYHLINLYKQEDIKHLTDLTREDKTLVFAYGLAGVGSSLALPDGVSIWTYLKKTFASLWYDHPSYNYRQHCIDSPYIINVYHINVHYEARQKHLPTSQSKSILLPPPCEIDHRTREIPFKKRSGRILYAKTAESLSFWDDAWAKQPKDIQDILHALTDLAKKDRNLDLSDAAAHLFDTANKDKSNLDIFMGVIQEVDGYIRAWRSDKLGRALLKHPADIIGRGWDYLKDPNNVATISGAIPANEYAKQMQEHKIVANSSPLWRDGIHERVVSAINAGAISLTDHSIKSDDTFEGLETYHGFDWNDNLEDVIAECLNKSDGIEEAPYDKIDSILIDKLHADQDRYFLDLMEQIESIQP